MQDDERRPVVGYTGLYEITRDGRIYSASRQGFGKPGEKGDDTRRQKTLSLNNTGYWRTVLWKDGQMRNHLVHRLVAEAFVLNPEGKPHVNHIDSDRANCDASNLEWCTHAENMAHASRMGRLRKKRHVVGSEHTRAKLTETVVEQARKRNEEGRESARSLAREHGVANTTMSRMIKRKTWKHVGERSLFDLPG